MFPQWQCLSIASEAPLGTRKCCMQLRTNHDKKGYDKRTNGNTAHDARFVLVLEGRTPPWFRQHFVISHKMAAAARVLCHSSDQDEVELVPFVMLPGDCMWQCSLLPAPLGHVSVSWSLRWLEGWTGGAGGLEGRNCSGQAGLSPSMKSLRMSCFKYSGSYDLATLCLVK